MRRSFLLLSVSLIMAAGVVAACKQKNEAAQGDDSDGGTQQMPPGDDDTTADDDAGNADQGTAAEVSNGIPCDVEAVIENRCWSCHGATAPQGPPLLKYEDFAAMSTDDPKQTRGQLAAVMMTKKEMPKAPGIATDDEIKTVTDWVASGMKKSDEACILAPTDAGAVNTTDGGLNLDAGTDGGGLCTSGVRWTQGNTGSDLMHPGGACIACHSTTQGGPAFSFAGTVFPTLHEVNDCNGVKGPVTVIIRDRKNKTIQTTSNAAGNFFIRTSAVQQAKLRPPYTVELQENGKSRKMQRTITGGDCNACHTTNGNGPPGRVLEPGAP